MAGDPPPNLLNAEQIRELLSRIPSRITNPEGDELYDVRPIRTTQGRWGIRDGIWTRDEREALEATYKHHTGQDIDLTELHRSEYEHLAGVMQTVMDAQEPGATAPGAIVSSEGPRNFDLDKAIVDRVVEHLSNARAHRVGMPLDDVANIRALYVAYQMEDQVYGEPATNMSGEPISGVATAPEGQYTARELNMLGELRRQILHARTRGFVTRPEEETPVVPTSVEGGGSDPDADVADEADTLAGEELEEYNRRYTETIQTEELPPIDAEANADADVDADVGADADVDTDADVDVETDRADVDVETDADGPEQVRDDPPEQARSSGRMTIVGEGTGFEPYDAEVEKLQSALVIAGYDVGTFPDHMRKAGEPLIDGYEGVLTRGAVMQAVADLKVLGIEVDPRTTTLTDFVAQIEDPETELRLKVLQETRGLASDSESIDYQERARELALSGEGLSTRDAFDDARAQPTGDGDNVVPDLRVEDPLVPR